MSSLVCSSLSCPMPARLFFKCSGWVVCRSRTAAAPFQRFLDRAVAVAMYLVVEPMSDIRKIIIITQIAITLYSSVPFPDYKAQRPRDDST